MRRYLFTIYQPDGEPPASVDLEQVTADVGALVEEMKAQGSWVFNGGLHPADRSTVVRAEGQQVLVTDGPYVEGKEHVGGLFVLDAPDLDAALGWGRRAARAIGLPIEIRPFQEHG